MIVNEEEFMTLIIDYQLKTLKGGATKRKRTCQSKRTDRYATRNYRHLMWRYKLSQRILNIERLLLARDNYDNWLAAHMNTLSHEF